MIPIFLRHSDTLSPPMFSMNFVAYFSPSSRQLRSQVFVIAAKSKLIILEFGTWEKSQLRFTKLVVFISVCFFYWKLDFRFHISFYFISSMISVQCFCLHSNCLSLHLVSDFVKSFLNFFFNLFFHFHIYFYFLFHIHFLIHFYFCFLHS